MTKKELHPSVQEFKEFVKKKPELIKDVRKGKTTWQQLYEEWYLLGDDDPKWKTAGVNSGADEGQDKKAAQEEQKPQFFQQLAHTIKNMDMDKVQYYIKNLDESINTIQDILSQMRSQQNQKQGRTGGFQDQNQYQNPFSFRRD